ncbi:MAG: nucleotidyltransferase domain-containing protein [Candidatus Paceibacterota bacterium]
MQEIMLTDQIKQTVASYFTDQPVSFMYLFGSQVTGNVHAESDVDIAVYFDSTVDISEVINMKIKVITLVAKALNVSEDIINITVIQDAPAFLRYVIVKEGILLYEKNRLERVDFELKTLQTEDDERAFRRQYNEKFLHKFMNT